MRMVRLGLTAFALLFLLVVGGLVGLRAWQQQSVARNLKIHSPDGVEQSGYWSVGDSDQWVQIRGEHRDNPIILFVHGGPGFAMAPMAPIFRDWEKDFTIVQWDQRDAGRTFSRNGAQPISIDQVTRDGLAISERLKREFGDRKIILLGQSWGSAVGLNMVHRRPDLFAAYVGAGQMVSKTEQEAIAYAAVLERLRASRNAKGVAELEASGPPPYKDLSALLVERKWLAVVDTPAERTLFRRLSTTLIFAPGQSLKELWDYNSAPKIAQQASFDEVARFEARAIGMTYETPIFIFEGDQDLNTPPGPTQQFLRELQAPLKKFVVLQGGGHSAALTMPQQFLAELQARVRPIAVSGPASAQRPST